MTKPCKTHVLADHLSRFLMDDKEFGVDDDLPDAPLFLVQVDHPWYADLAIFLSIVQYPPTLDKRDRKKLLLQSWNYTLFGEFLYKFFPQDGIYRRCVREDEVSAVLKSLHDEPCGGHFAGDLTSQKVLLAGYWRLTLFKDCHNYCHKCDKCQRFGRPSKQFAMPLTPILALKPFEKWDIDFLGPIPSKYRPN